MINSNDMDVLTKQLGRVPRGVLEISYRTPTGVPAVIKTIPRLADGTPFPTLYYLTEPNLVALISRLEAEGLMSKMSQKILVDKDLAESYQRAHRLYLEERNKLADLGTTFTGGGMPDRVKCLHFLVGHALAKGSGINPIGDETIALLKSANLGKDLLPIAWPENKYQWDWDFTNYE